MFVSCWSLPAKLVRDGKRVGVLIDWTEANDITPDNQEDTVKKSLHALFSLDDTHSSSP